MTQGFISIGSNIDPEIHIPAALQALHQEFGELLLSSVYESAAVGFNGDTFHNLIVKFSSELSIEDIAQALRNIEIAHGRGPTARKFSSRALDLDLILFGKQVINNNGLHIPRPEIERYAFVLEPLAEIAAEEQHPQTGQRFSELWQSFDKSQTEQHKVHPAWLADYSKPASR